MFGLSPNKSALVWILLLTSLVSVPYSLRSLYLSQMHGSAPNALATKLIREGAVVTLTPAKAKSITISDEADMMLREYRITGLRLKQTSNAQLQGYIDQLPDLENFTLDRFHMNGGSLLSVIDSLPATVSILRLNRVRDPAKEEHVLEAIGNKFERLKTLEVIKMAIVDADVQSLANASSLQVLNLAETAISDIGVQYLSGLKLTTLKLDGTKVTSAGLRYLPQTIKALGLGSLSIGDPDIAFLATSFPSLTSLNIQKTFVTDAAIPELAKLQQLKTLQIRGSNISVAGIEQLQQLMPNTKITY